MERVKSSSKEMALHQEAIDIVETLIPKDYTAEQWMLDLEEHWDVWKVVENDEVLGFYTLALEKLFGEGHAYVFPSHRKKSSAFIKLMIEHVKSMGRIPKTTATSDFPHVVKFLKMLGFTQMGVEKGGIIKSNGPVDVVYLLHI